MLRVIREDALVQNTAICH